MYRWMDDTPLNQEARVVFDGALNRHAGLTENGLIWKTMNRLGGKVMRNVLSQRGSGIARGEVVEYACDGESTQTLDEDENVIENGTCSLQEGPAPCPAVKPTQVELSKAE